MEECADEYAQYCLSVLEEVKKICKDPIVLIEQRLDFSKYVPEGFGTGVLCHNRNKGKKSYKSRF